MQTEQILPSTSPSQLDRTALWNSFFYEVYQATASLMFLLQGMESVREQHIAYFNSSSLARKAQAAAPTIYPLLSYLDVPLCLHGHGFKPDDVLQREGTAEQLAYRGWVEQIYLVWESRYRNSLKRDLDGTDVILPEADPLGDFIRIRNDLIHSGVASKKESGRCTVLMWFDPGEEIVLGMRHVLDFLNQLGLMWGATVALSHGPAAKWMVRPQLAESLSKGPIPEIVSLRPSFDRQDEDGTSWHIISVTFANAVFVDAPVPLLAKMGSVAERTRWVEQTRVDEQGDLRFANGQVKARKELYRDALRAMAGKGTKYPGLGVPGPTFQIRTDDPS